MTRRAKHILAGSLVVALTAASASAQAVPSFGNLPLYFEAQAQKDGTAQFLARGQDSQVLIAPTGVQLTLRDSASVQAQFLGANPKSQIHGAAELSGKINYLTGNDPAKWRTGIPTFAKVQVDNLYPGISALYYGNQRQLEYDFNISPGASPEAIAIHFKGAEKIMVNLQGQLVLSVGHGEILQPKPVIYQIVDGTRQEINGGYKIVGAQTVAFNVGNYNHSLPLVIDPILSYSSYFGGTSGDIAWAVALNTNDGSIFIAGQTTSTKFVTNGVAFSPAGSYQPNFKGGTYVGDAFVAKFDHRGTNLAYLTYLGGSTEDAALSLAVNSAGNAFVGGYTDSADFPITNSTPGLIGVPGITNHISGTPNKYDGHYPLDGFVAELSTNGASLVYSTYLGGYGEDAVYGVAVDSSDNAYVTGYTFSTNLPVKSPLAYQLKGRSETNLNYLACAYTHFNCNAFVAKINANGSSLGFLTYFGGNNFDVGYSIALDSAGFVYVAGYTSSTNFPTLNSFQANLNQTTNLSSAFDGFVAKLNPAGPTLVYASYLGSTNNDEALHIAADTSGAYVSGWTTSPAFPNSNTNLIANRITNNIAGIVTTNAFLTKITNNASASGVAYSTVFGGGLIDIGYGVAVDPAGNAFVTGSTTSGNFPATNSLGLLRTNNAGGNDVFVTAFNAAGSSVLYSVYLGGSADDFGYGIAVDSASTAYVVGQTASANFPTTTNSAGFPVYSALSKSLSGPSDSFLAKILLNFSPSLQATAVKTNLVKVSWLYNTNVAPELSGYTLQTSTNLLTTNWVTLTNALTYSSNLNSLTLPATNHYQFFRLHKP